MTDGEPEYTPTEREIFFEAARIRCEHRREMMRAPKPKHRVTQRRSSRGAYRVHVTHYKTSHA